MYSAQKYAAAKGRESARVDVTAKVKSWFFDRKVVLEFMDRKTLETMKKSAFLVRKIASNSMRRRRAASSPGQPPSAHGEGRGPLLKKFLFASFDPVSMSAVIGPTLLHRKDNAKVPQNLEHGTTIRRRNPRRRIRQIGNGGELRIGGPSCATTHTRTPWPGYNGGKPVEVTYGRIRTAAQAARANELNENLYGPAMIEGTLAPRPYMGPALVAAAPSLPSFYSR